MYEPIVNHRKFQLLHAILHECSFSICIDKYDIVHAAGNSEYVNYSVDILSRQVDAAKKFSLRGLSDNICYITYLHLERAKYDMLYHM